ncbi:MAG TPA: choice-of-anchor D domain-containing protein, partial [Pirellulaceae bacterium]|nr:choice-of-anchor D domain-containing protein [Pirellulaceae bacterium]
GQSLSDGQEVIDFGTATAGTPQSITLTLQNLGSAPLVIPSGGLALPSGYSLAESLPESIEPGGSVAVTINLLVLAPGDYSGTLALTTNDEDESPFEIELTGIVQAANPQIEILDEDDQPLASSGTLAFGATSPGVAVTRTLTIVNSGTTPLVLDLQSLSLPAGYSLMLTPAATVEPGDWTPLAIQLDADELGNFSGELSLASNDAAASPFVLQLTGSVNPPPPEIEVLAGSSLSALEIGQTLDLGQTLVGQPIQVRGYIRNAGTGLLTIDVGSIAIPAGFALAAAPAATVEPGQWTEFTLELAATASGAFSGIVSIPNSDPDESPFQFTVQGQVNPPAPVAMVRILGRAVPAMGSAVRSLGVAVVGTPLRGTFVIANEGTASLEVTNVALPSGFTLVSSPAAPIPAGAQGEVVVELTAASAGTFEGDLTFATNDTAAASFAIPIRGTVVASATQIEVREGATLLASGATIDLGSIMAGTATSVTLEIRNVGSSTLVLDPAAIALPAGLTLTGVPAETVAPSGATNLTVSLDTSLPASFSGTLSFSSNGQSTPFRVTLLADVLPSLTGLGIGSVELENDDGASNTDRVTTDPRLRVQLVNAQAEELPQLRVEVDLDNDDLPEASAAVAADSVSIVQLDERSLAAGPVAARVRLTNQTTGAATDWQAFSFTYELPDMLPTVALQLAEDTGTPGDLITSNPIVAGTVTVAAGTAANLEVAIDLNGDDKADFSTRTDALGAFSVDPRQILPQLAAGQITVRAQARQFDPRRQTLAANDWVSLTFEYAIVRQLPQVQNLQADQSASDLAFGEVRITGGVVDPDAQTRFLSVEYDIDGDGTVDGEVYASPIDGSPFDFVVEAKQLPAGERTIQVRGVKLVRQTAERIVGNWQSVTFQNTISQPALPLLSALAFQASQDADGSKNHAIAGHVSRSGAPAGGATVEYDLDGDGQRDGLTFSRHDADGSFQLDLSRHGLLPGAHTVQLRARAWDADRRQMVASDWQEFTFTIDPIAQPVLPDLQSLTLAVDTGTPGDGITSLPKIAGTAQWADETFGDFVVEYELLGENSGSGRVIALAALDGEFVLDLSHIQFADPQIELRLRARGWNASRQELVSEWEDFAFTLSSSANVLPSITAVGLLEDTGTAGDNVSTNATLTGSVSHPDGSASVVPVQYDLNSDGIADGFVNTMPDGTFSLDLNARFTTQGPRTVALRAGELNAAGQYVYGGWTSFSFTVERAGPPPTAVVTSLRLLNDTGEDDDDGITSDPRITGTVVLSDGSLAAGLPVEIDYTGDGYSDEIAVTDPTGGGFVADLRDRIHEAGPVTVRFRAGVPAETVSGFQYGEWTSLTFEFELDPIAPSTTPEASLPPLDVTVIPPSPPPYAQYYADPILFAYGELYGILTLADIAGGQFDLFGSRFGPHPQGNVSTVVTVDESDTQTYPGSEPDGGTLTVTTTLNSTLTTNATLGGDGTWTVSEILVSTYLIVKTYSSTSGLSYTLTQSGTHNYTFTASGDADDALYSLNETRLDEWSSDREDPESTSGGLTVSVVSSGESSQGFTFIASGWRLFPSGGSMTEHEDWDYTSTADGEYSITTTTGDDAVVEESSHSATGHDLIVTDLVSGVRTTVRNFLHEGQSEASATDGADWSSGSTSSSWDRTVTTATDSRWQGTLTTVDDGLTVSRTGSYDQDQTIIYEWDVDSAWSGSEVIAAPLGSITRLLSNTHHYDKQEKYEHQQQWQVDDELVTHTGGSTITTITVNTLDHWSADEKQNLTTASAGTTVTHNIQRLTTTDNSYSWLQRNESDYTVSSSGKTESASTSALTTRHIQEQKETETENLSASGKITATGVSNYSAEFSTDITTDTRSGDDNGDTWLSYSEAGERHGLWMHSLTSNISGTSGGGDAPLVSFKFSAQSQSNGSGKQTYSSNAY